MKFPSVLAILGCLAIGQTYGINFGVGDVVSSARSIGSGLAKTAVNAIPSVDEVLEASKQVLAGYPFEVVSDVINQICSKAVAAKTITPKITPDLNKMNFQLKTACKNYTFPLTKAQDMWKSPGFDAKKKVVLFATGWTNTVNESNPLTLLSKSYFCRNDVNFIVVDAANFVDTLYTWSALNTDEIGRNVAIGLSALMGIVPVEKIHLIGHSLGAHIVGAAARYFNELTGEMIARVTGLDPAKPCFNEGSNLSGLLRGYSKTVDVIHSNPGVLGIREPLGDVDFYPGGLGSLAPGTFNIMDSHLRAVEYFAESVYPGNEQSFQATRCTSLSNVQNNKCHSKTVAMGFAASDDLKGNYFLEVNSKSPYGKGIDQDVSLKNMNCGKCEDTYYR